MAEKQDLFSCHSLQEAAGKFSLTELVNFAMKNTLSGWLAENFYLDESEKISAAIKNEVDDAEFKLLICKIFNLDFAELSESDIDKISAHIAKNQRKEIFFKYADTDKKSAYVINQGELVKALRNGAEILYLDGAEFRIPVALENKIYVGINNAVIDFTHDSDIDLDAKNIVLEDLQIFLHYPITVKAENSKNLKIINGTKKALGVHPTLKEIFEILRGRNAFESAEKFRRRAENIRGAAVGTILLEDKNYNYDAEYFSVQPNWNFEYIAVLKDYAQDKIFTVKLDHANAELLYQNERKLQIFADLTYIDGRITILNLYLETNTLGRINIESILREVEIKLDAGSSNAENAGYGLEIITAYKD